MLTQKRLLTYIFALFFLLNLLVLFSCSKKESPTSPTNNGTQDDNRIKIENINFSVTVGDTIPTAFLNNFAKWCNQNNCGLVEININNNNDQNVHLKVSVIIEDYSNEITNTFMIAAHDSQTVNVTPVLTTEQLNKLNEIKTVQCSVKALLLTENADKEIFNQTYTRWMLAKDYMMWGDNFEFLPLIVIWVTPNVPEIELLISKAKKYHPDKQLIGYQGSESEDGYRKIQKNLSGTINIPPGEEKIAWSEYIDTDYMKNCIISVNFEATGGSGNDIKTRLEVIDPEFLHLFYWSDQIHQDTFNKYINKSGLCRLIFDNSPSWWYSRTVSYNVTISYDEDLIIPQVRAIYYALQKDYDIDYVSSLISYPSKVTQQIRLPQDALIYHSANCIDGTVLFASALEKIDLEPLIVLVPSHAFVGWRRWTGSNYAEFLETTMIGHSSFEDAYNEGNRKYFDNPDKSDIITIDVKYVKDTYDITPLMKKLSKL